VFRAGVDGFDGGQHLPVSASSSRPGRDAAAEDVKCVITNTSVAVVY